MTDPAENPPYVNPSPIADYGGRYRPRLLDLFCGAGGAAMGYHRAGFDVVGVDIKPQPRYPFEFHQADAMTFPLDGFDAIHASPPCQDWSQLHRNYGAPEHGTAWLLLATLERLAGCGRPWVVENVVGAPMPSPIELCGATFGLGAAGFDLNRHRRFQCSFAVMAHPCQHRRGKSIGVYGNGTNKWHRAKGVTINRPQAREAMGIDWMSRKELNQAIPPAYTEWLGARLLDAVALSHNDRLES
jgi:DNA (cytosine-5)-methyltransferase 1